LFEADRLLYLPARLKASTIDYAENSSSLPGSQVLRVKYSILALVLFALLHGPWASAAAYRVVTEEWAPYNYQEDGRLTGLSTEIVRAIMARTGDDFSIELLPSMRSSHILQTQPRTIMYSLFRTPEREALYQWVGPIVEESIHAYQLASATHYLNSLDALYAAPRITTRHAGLVPNVLAAAGFSNLDRSAGESQQLYRMLLAGRTGIVVGDTDAGVAYYSRLLQIPPGSLRRIPVELYRSSLYIAFSLDSDAQLVANWQRALEALRESGELARIQRRYE